MLKLAVVSQKGILRNQGPKRGKLIGYLKGIRGSEILDEQSASKNILFPMYKQQLEGPCRDLVEEVLSFYFNLSYLSVYPVNSFDRKPIPIDLYLFYLPISTVLQLKEALDSGKKLVILDPHVGGDEHPGAGLLLKLYLEGNYPHKLGHTKLVYIKEEKEYSSSEGEEENGKQGGEDDDESSSDDEVEDKDKGGEEERNDEEDDDDE